MYEYLARGKPIIATKLLGAFDDFTRRDYLEREKDKIRKIMEKSIKVSYSELAKIAEKEFFDASHQY